MSMEIIGDSVSNFLEEKFIPKYLESANSQTVARYRCVLKRTAEYLGHEVSFAELSDHLISNLSDYLLDNGMNENRVRKYRQALRALAVEGQSLGYKTGWISSIDPKAKGKGSGNRHRKFKRDMRGPKAKTLRQLSKAAALFANGFKLAEIGERLGVTKDAVHNWRGRYSKEWQEAYKAAVQKSLERVLKETQLHAGRMKQASFNQRANGVERALQAEGNSIVKPDDGPPTDVPTLFELVEDFAMERGNCEATTRHYKAIIRSMERYCGKRLFANDFAREWVNEWLMELEGADLSPHTVYNHRTHAIAIWNAAYHREFCDTPKRIRTIKVVHKLPDAWSCEEVNCLLAQAAKITGFYSCADVESDWEVRIKKSRLWRLIVRVLWDTGLRLGDAFRLKLDDVSEDGVILVSQNKTSQAHIVKLHQSTLNLVNQIERPKSGLMLPLVVVPKHRRVCFDRDVLKPTGLVGTMKKIRKSSASDVELHHPGLGAFHLGHRAGRDIARLHYLDPRIIAKNRPMPSELKSDL